MKIIQYKNSATRKAYLLLFAAAGNAVCKATGNDFFLLPDWVSMIAMLLFALALLHEGRMPWDVKPDKSLKRII